MPATLDDFLKDVAASRGARFANITCLTTKFPGKGMTVKSRIDGTPNPYTKGIGHYYRGEVLLKASYENMVQNQRERELKGQLQDIIDSMPAYVYRRLEELEENPFRAETLWGGKGVRDEQYPTLLAYHRDTKHKVLVHHPLSDEQGRPKLQESYYMDLENGYAIDELYLREHFLDKRSKPKTQETEKHVLWGVVGIENIRKIAFAGKIYEIA